MDETTDGLRHGNIAETVPPRSLSFWASGHMQNLVFKYIARTYYAEFGCLHTYGDINPQHDQPAYTFGDTQLCAGPYEAEAKQLPTIPNHTMHAALSRPQHRFAGQGSDAPVMQDLTANVNRTARWDHVRAIQWDPTAILR